MDGTSKLKYCPCCMELGSMEGLENCPRCGRSLGGVENGKEELQIYSVIGGRYMAGKSKDAEGDSVLYIGLDLTEKKRVWIREFFCRSLAYRNPGSPSIHTYAGQKEAYLKEYDGCVREYQKAGNGKKVAFANGTVYQVTPLSDEEILALCQASDAAGGQGGNHGKKEEGKTLPENRERKKVCGSIVSSKKMKAAVAAMLAVCLAAGLLQKYGPVKNAGTIGKEAGSASASVQLKSSRSPDPASNGSADGASVSASADVLIPEASQMPDAEPRADANLEAEESAVPEATKDPGDSKMAKGPGAAGTTNKPADSKAANKKAAKKKTNKSAAAGPAKKPAPPKPTREPENSKDDKKPAPARKSPKKKNAQKPKKQTRQKKKTVIDDSALDKKVYEID